MSTVRTAITARLEDSDDEVTSPSEAPSPRMPPPCTQPTVATLVEDTAIAWDAVREAISNKRFCLTEIHKSPAGMGLLAEAMTTKPLEKMINSLNAAYTQACGKKKPIGGKVEVRRANLREMVCTLDFEEYVEEFTAFLDTEEGDYWFSKLVDRACKNTELGRAPKFGAMEYIRLLHVLVELR